MTTLINNLSTTAINSVCNLITIPTSNYIGSDVNSASTTAKVQPVLPSTATYLTSTGSQTLVSQTAITITTPQITSSSISLGSNTVNLNMLNSGTLTMFNFLQYPVNSGFLRLLTSKDSNTQQIQRSPVFNITTSPTINTINFLYTFATIPTVIGASSGTGGARCAISNVTVDSFQVVTSNSGFSYIAVG